MADLVLQHGIVSSHREFWTVDNGRVNIHSVCPQNHPKEDKFNVSPIQALRLFALMTSKTEGWEVIEETDKWHEFVDNIEVKD